ncbi:MAG: helix-turn-helix transcriptional regulator [Saprospiraceae bacterium]
MNLQVANQYSGSTPNSLEKYWEQEENLISWMKEKINQSYLSNQEKSKFQQSLECLGDALAQKNRSLISKEIQLGKKQAKLKETREKILEVAANTTLDRQTLEALAQQIEEELDFKKSRQNFQVYFEKIHTKFFYKLSGAFPKLTKNELRHCAYLKINMSTKEVSELLRISPKSVSMAHYRIRKKLQLEDRANLYHFLKKY